MRERRSRDRCAIACGAALLLRWAALAGADSPTGHAGELPTLTSAAKPTGIVDGPDGNLWFIETEHGASSLNYHVGSITPSGAVAEYSLGTQAPPPTGAITSAAGELWFPDELNGHTGQLDRSRCPGRSRPSCRA